MASDLEADRISPPEPGAAGAPSPPPLYRVSVYRDNGGLDFVLHDRDLATAGDRYRAACGMHGAANVRLVEVMPDGTIRDVRPEAVARVRWFDRPEERSSSAATPDGFRVSVYFGRDTQRWMASIAALSCIAPESVATLDQAKEWARARAVELVREVGESLGMADPRPTSSIGLPTTRPGRWSVSTPSSRP